MASQETSPLPLTPHSSPLCHQPSQPVNKETGICIDTHLNLRNAQKSCKGRRERGNMEIYFSWKLFLNGPPFLFLPLVNTSLLNQLMSSHVFVCLSFKQINKWSLLSGKERTRAVELGHPVSKPGSDTYQPGDLWTNCFISLSLFPYLLTQADCCKNQMR